MQCNLRHPSELGPNGALPLFTDYSFDNLGVPQNSQHPFYSDGYQLNPAAPPAI